MTEYQGCYKFEPEQAETASQIDQRPSKRKKTSNATLRLAQNELLPFVPLLSGSEHLECIQTRLESFAQAWSLQEELLQALRESSNTDAINEVVSFIQGIDFVKTEGKIPTGLIIAGPSIGTDAGLFDSIIKGIKLGERAIAVNLDSVQTSNLKSALKYINQYATNQALDVNDEQTDNDRQQGGCHLSYDLQILYEYVQIHSIGKVLIIFQDSEASDGSFLADLIEVLSSWNDRIPIVLLFGIATSIEMFQNKISRAASRCLQAVRFDIAQLDMEDTFKAATAFERPIGPWLGPNISGAVLQRQKDYVQSTAAFIHSMKYVYMTHFFANPLSIFLNHSELDMVLQPEHYEAVRNLPSFQRYIENLVDAGDYKTAQTLLKEDLPLHKVIVLNIKAGHEALQTLIQALEVISAIQSSLVSKSRIPYSELYITGMSGRLRVSPIVEEGLLSLQKLSSNSLLNLLAQLLAFQIPSLPSLHRDLVTLATTLSQPLRSAQVIHSSTLRTRIVAQKVELSMHAASLTNPETTYAALSARAAALLQEYLDAALIAPQELFLHEILIYDFRSPYRDVFAPRPRAALERALSAPHDYLGCEWCECCNGLESALAPTQPATAVLYQLYCESGAIVNVADLWAAFHAVIGNEQVEDEEVERERVLALFSSALAELKYLGMVKHSRKKADHVAKLLWQGL